tara:strand:- start:992 stop:1285 length:294 start_codon:yes stop_codon:yes gene_type:complete
MGKAKRATRKELEEVISDIIQELGSLRTMINALNSYVGFYIEWKGDKITYNEALKKKFDEAQGGTGTSSMGKSNGNMGKGNVKSEKKDRYRKISTPL